MGLAIQIRHGESGACDPSLPQVLRTGHNPDLVGVKTCPNDEWLQTHPMLSGKERLSHK